jgi:5,10-methylenetetrahydrofolate reductase
LNSPFVNRTCPFFYGTTPPRADAPPERFEMAAERLSARIARLQIDGIVVYDVQDEAGRTTEPRPFPFLPTHDSRVYGQLLHHLSGKPAIAYKCVAQMSETAFRDWLDETAERYGIHQISLVGRATSAGHEAGISLLQAIRIAAEAGSRFRIGGVVIPERHTPERSESARLVQKSLAGCDYFISQAVYSPDAVIALCRDYAADCAAQGVPPRRIVLTFTPCGREQTMGFMKWLGITIPAATELQILGADDPLAASIRVCADNFRRILASGVGASVPLGVNVESVSINKAEIAGSVELCRTLQAVAAEF